MQCIKPTSCLVNTFCYKICRKILFKCFFVLKRKMPLRIRHCAAVEPNVNQVWYAFHRFAFAAYQYYFINIRFVQIKNPIVEIIFIGIAAQCTSVAFLISAFSSATLPMHFSSPPLFFSIKLFSASMVFQMGNGVPQKRLRLRFQSTMFSSQLPKRPSPVDLGFQLMVLFSSTILSFTAVVLMNHASSG